MNIYLCSTDVSDIYNEINDNFITMFNTDIICKEIIKFLVSLFKSPYKTTFTLNYDTAFLSNKQENNYFYIFLIYLNYLNLLL